MIHRPAAGTGRLIALTGAGLGAVTASLVLVLSARTPTLTVLVALLLIVPLLVGGGVNRWFTRRWTRMPASRKGSTQRPARDTHESHPPSHAPFPSTPPHPTCVAQLREDRHSAVPADVAEAEPLAIAVPVPGGAWWNRTREYDIGPGGSARRPSPQPSRPLSSYTASARLVQCPCCASFKLQLILRPPIFDFGCLSCGHRWSWQRGAMWPRTVLRPFRPDDPQGE
jgi:hypothetical protein